MLFSRAGFSQQSSFIRNKIITTEKDTIHIDTLSLVPGSLIFLKPPSLRYKIDEATANLIWLDSNRVKNDSFEIIYKVFSIRFDKVYFKRKKNEATSFDQQRKEPLFKESSIDNKENLFGLSGFNKAGSIDRKSTRLNSSHSSVSRMPSSA